MHLTFPSCARRSAQAKKLQASLKGCFVPEENDVLEKIPMPELFGIHCVVFCCLSATDTSSRDLGFGSPLELFRNLAHLPSQMINFHSALFALVSVMEEPFTSSDLFGKKFELIFPFRIGENMFYISFSSDHTEAHMLDTPKVLSSFVPSISPTLSDHSPSCFVQWLCIGAAY